MGLPRVLKQTQIGQQRCRISAADGELEEQSTPAMEPLMLVPSRKPVRRRIALRCIRRSRFRDVLGDGPTIDCPDAYSCASYIANKHSKAVAKPFQVCP